jgi:hypothetical protein
MLGGLAIVLGANGCGPSPAAVPLTLADCGLADDTAIAFQGWGTEAELGMMVSSPTHERLYWIITAEPVELVSSRGSGNVRAGCAVGEDGLLSVRTVSDDWQPPPEASDKAPAPSGRPSEPASRHPAGSERRTPA